MASGSFALAEELFARGDAAFVGELRRVDDAERLGNFAARWLADPRPIARKLLIDYLSGPLNAYRHEALVKRLFKGIEKAGDDELMGVLLVAFDRSIRRARKTITRRKWESLSTQAEAEGRLGQWESEGYTGNISSGGRWFYVFAQKTMELIVAPNNTMPRPREKDWKKNQTINDYYRQSLEKRYVLFSLPTRRYLRR